MNNSESIISSGRDTDDQDDLDESAEPSLDYESRALIVGEAHHGLRLDLALVDLVPEFSRSYLQQLIELGAVSIGAATVRKSSYRVKAGDRGLVQLRPTPQSQAFKAEAMRLSVVYEDEHLLVIDKPAGLVVHPAPGNWSGTLLNGLLARDESAKHLPRAGIVHRLDKDTSGLMVVARTRACMDALVKMIAAREVSRQYLALCHGPWLGPSRQEVDAPIGRDPRNRLRMAVVDLDKAHGKVARTTVELLAPSALGCLVRCTLHTGRTHQIRVHMASLGHPLVADSTYGGVAGAGMLRQSLHAFRLAFAHPVLATEMSFTVPPPDDLRLALIQWGLSYNGL